MAARRRILGTAPSIEEDLMASVARVTTITARSEQSFDDAISAGVARASETLRNVSGAWVKEQKIEASDGVITGWSVTLEVTFVLDD
ncbi:dodecin family protein [Agromyces sp. NBRC 114283]|nr:dodecin family protein [Agromyces sp. NBRC 114283]